MTDVQKFVDEYKSNVMLEGINWRVNYGAN